MPDMGRRPAVFLDRDGTVVQERDYLDDPGDVELVAGAVEAIRALRSAGYAVVLVTNQSGIARGLYSLEDYRAVAERVDEVLLAAGASMDGTYYCPHHPDFTEACECRKPGTGMYVRAARDLDLDLAASYYVGDKVSDVLPALALGGTPMLVRTGYGREHETLAPSGTRVANDLRAAAQWILTGR